MLIPVNVLMTAELPLISLPFFFVPSFAIDGSTSMQVKPSASMRFQVDANEVQRHYNSMVSPMESFCTIPTGSIYKFFHLGISSVYSEHDNARQHQPAWHFWKI